MDTKLLETVAQKRSAMVLMEHPDIDAFLCLQAEGLIDGSLHVLPGGKRYATIYGLTPGGNALLASRWRSHSRTHERPVAH